MINREKLRELILSEPDGMSVEAGGLASLRNPPDLTKPEIRDAFEAGMALGVELGRMNPLEKAMGAAAQWVRCPSRQPHGERVQCELQAGHKTVNGLHLCGEYCWQEDERGAATAQPKEGKA